MLCGFFFPFRSRSRIKHETMPHVYTINKQKTHRSLKPNALKGQYHEIFDSALCRIPFNEENRGPKIS
jgi:hypothetical protein